MGYTHKQKTTIPDPIRNSRKYHITSQKKIARAGSFRQDSTTPLSFDIVACPGVIWIVIQPLQTWNDRILAHKYN